MVFQLLDDEEEWKKDKSSALLISMMIASKLIFHVAAIRDFVNEHHEDLYQDESVQKSNQRNTSARNPKDLVKFANVSNIITRHCEDSKRHLQSTFLKKPIIFSEVVEFARENRNLLKEIHDVHSDEYKLRNLEDREKPWNKFPKSSMEKDFEALGRKFDGEIVEFDDEFDNSELLFGIVLNRTEKRIICVFRGSKSGGKDWATNKKLLKEKLDNIKDAKTDLGLKEFGHVGLHYGWANYLFNDEWTHDGQPSKFEQIVDILREIRTKKDPNGNGYKDYGIFVTGHSLGGALTQLLSFALAGSTITRDELPKPVIAITYGSPRVGNSIWLREYQSLEKKGHLRHIRVSNDGDRVSAVPSLGYLQTGVNIHLYPNKKADISYDKRRSILSAVAMQCKYETDMHALNVYYERLIGNKGNRRILKYTVEQFYREYARTKNTVRAILDECDDYGFTEDHTVGLYRDFLSS